MSAAPASLANCTAKIDTPPGALHQYGVARANVGFLEKCPPGRECGAGQRGGFFERQIRRRAAYAFRIEDIEPRLEEHRAHSLAHRDAGYVFSESRYLASTVRERDQW